MIRPDFSKWNQTAREILTLSIESEHPRDREQYLALYMIGTGQTNATRWSQEVGRQDDTVIGWVHLYNEAGPEGVRWRPSGGKRPLFAKQQARRS